MNTIVHTALVQPSQKHAFNVAACHTAARLMDWRVSYLKELLGLLELQGVLRRLRLRVVGRLGLVAHEAVVRDHDGGREDGRGHEDGVTVDLLHGELGCDDLLLQRVSAQRTGQEEVINVGTRFLFNYYLDA